uniref:Uncharacterized protein n=1 Tax=Molossus molossus TaxID=27622 RepID=A0A7J8F941_MOLMO|nr:hypothetical protein HJG59_008522 [Molossus molossus]
MFPFVAIKCFLQKLPGLAILHEIVKQLEYLKSGFALMHEFSSQEKQQGSQFWGRWGHPSGGIHPKLVLPVGQEDGDTNFSSSWGMTATSLIYNSRQLQGERIDQSKATTSDKVVVFAQLSVLKRTEAPQELEVFLLIQHWILGTGNGGRHSARVATTMLPQTQPSSWVSGEMGQMGKNISSSFVLGFVLE